MMDKRNIDIFLLDDFTQIETLCRNVYFSANISFIHVFLSLSARTCPIFRQV